MRQTKKLAVLAGLVIAMAGGHVSFAQPASRPGAGEGAGGRQGPLMKVREIIAGLSLSDEQNKDISTILQEAQQKVRQGLQGGAGGAGGAAGGQEKRREKLKEVMTDAVKAIAEKLTDEQKQTFKEKLSELQGGKALGEGLGAGATSRPTGGGGKLGGRFKGAGAGAGAGEKGSEKSEKPAAEAKPLAEAPAETTLEAGQEPPTLTAKRSDGNAVNLAVYKGKTVVLIFGSYSSPTLRDKAAKLADVVQTFRNRNVDFLFVYTSEAFPSGDHEIERNHKDGIAISQATTFADRQVQAKSAMALLKLNMSCAVDTIDNATAKSYGLLPNGAVVVGKDGTILDVEKWMDPFAMRTTLEAATHSGQ